MPYQCDASDGQAAVMLITDLTDGSVQALCGPHIPSWVAELYGSFSAAGVYDEPAGDKQPAETSGAGAAPDDGESQDGGDSPGVGAVSEAVPTDTPPY